jgi:uncharacterized SAM-binding protein YcdF (DUF218 family)
MRKLVVSGLAIAVVLLAIYLGNIVSEIYRQSNVDEARPADVILILGAAEYRGKPSPALKARLDHGLWLYHKLMAPRIMTTGGAGGDPMYTEADVGRAYLVERGIPSEAIIVEDESATTVQSTASAAEIMRRMGLKSCIVVSDGYHIFRVKKMLEFRGLDVYGSPRPSVPKGTWREKWLYIKQSFGYLLWQIGITI